MTFTTNIFLFCILPFFIVFYYFFRNRLSARKLLIILANTVFYIYGGLQAFLITCAICLLTWVFVSLVCKHQSKAVFVCGCVLILLPLLVFKYTGFLFENINKILNIGIQAPKLLVPIGLSFYTFEAISLLADVYRAGKQEIQATKNTIYSIDAKNKIPYIVKRGGWSTLVEIYSYLTFFPTVVSGPIVRYSDFIEGYSKPLTAASFNKGVERFAIGLCKKALIADKLAVLADHYFDAVSVGNTFSSAGLWIGSIAYTLQLYFDFSGYSDMAIGIACLLGFDIPENFNRPYLASSIQDFWRRWHISLSSWFRDYVYIPLGGNRCSVGRHIINLLAVWILTGIWHGADWSFVIWGLGYFVLLMAEKYFKPIKNVGRHWYGHIYTLFFVNLLWIPFRSDSLQTAANFIRGMFSFTGGIEEKAINFMPLLCIAILICLPWNVWLERFEKNKAFRVLRGVVLLSITALAICAVLNSTYSPYIYGNF